VEISFEVCQGLPDKVFLVFGKDLNVVACGFHEFDILWMNKVDTPTCFHGQQTTLAVGLGRARLRGIEIAEQGIQFFIQLRISALTEQIFYPDQGEFKAVALHGLEQEVTGKIVKGLYGIVGSGGQKYRQWTRRRRNFLQQVKTA